MATNRRLALICLTLAALLLGTLTAWSAINGGTPPGILPPAGDSLPGGRPLTFAVMGDSRGNNSVLDRLLRSAQAHGARFVLYTGDMVRDASPAQYDWMLQEIAELDLRVPLCVVPGNHDVDRRRPVPGLLYERAFGPRNYWFTCADSLFVAFDDTTDNCNPRDLQWLDETLARLRPGYGACFVYTHVPPYDPRQGRAHCLSEASGKALSDVLLKHEVTALFAGHIHSYLEGSFNGTPVFITGGAGAMRDAPDGPYHYLLCDLNKDGSLSVRKVDVADLPDTEYAEYVFRTKFAPQLVLVVSCLLLLGGLLFAWRGCRRVS